MDEIFCRYTNLPSRVNAVTVVDENGDFNVYINNNLSDEAQRAAFQHEKRHILKKHFYRYNSVTECEQEAEP